MNIIYTPTPYFSFLSSKISSSMRFGKVVSSWDEIKYLGCFVWYKIFEHKMEIYGSKISTIRFPFIFWENFLANAKSESFLDKILILKSRFLRAHIDSSQISWQFVSKFLCSNCILCLLIKCSIQLFFHFIISFIFFGSNTGDCIWRCNVNI